MIKKIGLKIRNRSALRKNQTPRVSTSFTKASKAAILISDLSNKTTLIEPFINELQKEGKVVEVINYIDQSDIIHKENISNIDKNDIDWKGKIKADFIEKFLKTEFDYLFSLQTSSFLPFENLLARSKAKCRVGYYIEGKEDFLDIMLNSEGDNAQRASLQRMLEITKNT